MYLNMRPGSVSEFEMTQEAQSSKSFASILNIGVVGGNKQNETNNRGHAESYHENTAFLCPVGSVSSSNRNTSLLLPSTVPIRTVCSTLFPSPLAFDTLGLPDWTTPA